MVKKIKTVAKVIKIGNSLGITLSKSIRELLELKRGDYLQISIEKIGKKENEE